MLFCLFEYIDGHMLAWYGFRGVIDQNNVLEVMFKVLTCKNQLMLIKF